MSCGIGSKVITVWLVSFGVETEIDSRSHCFLEIPNSDILSIANPPCFSDNVVLR